MKTNIILFFLVVCTVGVFAQQLPSYSQYMLNNVGLNPAYAGENGPLEIIMGRRTQWVGFPGAPVTMFAGISRALGKKGFYHSWHGIGAYVESDDEGIFATKSVSVMYAWHKRLKHNYNISIGASVGGTSYGMSNYLQSSFDPAFASTIPVFIFPIFNPGIRLFSRRLYFDLAAKQVLDNRTVNIDGVKEIGVKQTLSPELFFTVGRQFTSPNYAWTVTPSFQLLSSAAYFPTIDLNVLVYYHKAVGVGISYRYGDAIVMMIQFRYFNKMVLGLSFDYSVSQFSNGGSNSREVMFGYTPYGSTAPPTPGSHIAQCPGFDL